MGSGAGVIVGSVGETAELCTSDVHRAWNRANATSGFIVYIMETKLPVNYEVERHFRRRKALTEAASKRRGLGS